MRQRLRSFFQSSADLLLLIAAGLFCILMLLPYAQSQVNSHLLTQKNPLVFILLAGMIASAVFVLHRFQKKKNRFVLLAGTALLIILACCAWKISGMYCEGCAACG